jgi:hypothetical protein
MKIKIDDLDLSLQTRSGTDAETINNYAEAMADGAQFPDVTVFTDGKHYWLADGFHRVMAAKQLGKKQISADIRKGTEDDAVVFGGTANNKQGKRPTRADVQHFLEMVWARREAIFGGTPTGGNFAEKCGVSNRTGDNFVRAKLAEMPVAPVRSTPQVAQLPTRPNAPIQAPKMPVRPTQLVGANGKMYPVRPVRESGNGLKVQGHVVPLDRFGVEIPVEINGAFEQDELNEVIRNISDARSVLRSALEAGVEAFKAVRQDALIQLNNAYSFVKSAKAHCVCRICQGNGCKACHERGWQTEEEYDRNPKEFKA